MKELTLQDLEKELKLSSKQTAEIQSEIDLIKASIEVRKKSNLTQKMLSEKSGIAQPAIAKIEKRINSPTLLTFLKLLHATGHTLKIIPISKK